MLACGNPPYRIIHRPTPFDDEGLGGWLIRTASQNSYSRPSWIVALSGVAQSNFHGLAETKLIDLLAAGNAATALLNMRASNDFGFPGGRVNRKFLAADGERVCPQCLEDDNYIRAGWQVRLAPVCTKHGKVLLDRCHECGAAISWNRAHVDRCGECGACFRLAACAAASESSLALARLIHNRLFGQALAVPFKAPISELQPNSRFALADFLARYDAAGKQRSLDILLTRHPPRAMQPLASIVSVILQDWPYGFFELIDRIHLLKPPEASGCSREFSNFYYSLRRHFSSGETSFVFTAFREYLLGKGGYGYAANWLGGGASHPRADVIPRPEVARVLQVSSETVNVLHKEGEIEGVCHPLGLTRGEAYFTRRSVMAYRLRRRDVIQSEGAARLLGVSRRTFRLLVDGGLLRSVDRVIYRPRKAYEIKRTTILDLILALENVALPHSGESAISFQDAAANAGRIGLTLADLFHAALDGSIRIYKTAGPGLRKFLFDRDELERFVATARRQLPDDRTLIILSQALHIGSGATSRLIRKRVLRPGTSDADPLGISAFRERYVSAAKLAEPRRLTPRSLISYLGRRGIHPVLGRSVDVSAAIYDRSKLPEDLIGAGASDRISRKSEHPSRGQ